MTVLRRRMTILTMAFASIALAGVGLVAPASAKGVMTVTQPEPGVHAMGSDQAKVKLTEYVSYTCSHCAHFEEAAGDPLRLFYVASGKTRLEVRHLVRDPFDLVAAMLANCGPVSRFDRNHAMFMKEQKIWLGKLTSATPAQRNRYGAGTHKARRRAIAKDAGFYPMMQRRGYDVTTIDRCLADDKMAEMLANKTASYVRDKGIASTPAFAIDDVLLAGTNTWDSLKFQLDLRL